MHNSEIVFTTRAYTKNGRLREDEMNARMMFIEDAVWVEYPSEESATQDVFIVMDVREISSACYEPDHKGIRVSGSVHLRNYTGKEIMKMDEIFIPAGENISQCILDAFSERNVRINHRQMNGSSGAAPIIIINDGCAV